MLKVKLIDLSTVTVEDVQFGTCELCMHTYDIDETTWVFEDRATGKTHRIDGQEWCWGDVFQVPPVENVADFAAWLKDRDASNEYPPFSFEWLRELVEEYLDQKEQPPTISQTLKKEYEKQEPEFLKEH